MDGQPANGPSYVPAAGGGTGAPANCVAFVSQASNLVPGDTNGVADAFLWRADTGAISRVSLGSRGQQADGPTYDVSVSGNCKRVAFTSTATNLAPRTTRRLAWKSAVTSPPQPGHPQVYVRFLGSGSDRPFRGLTMLASASGSREPGNGDSSEPELAASGKTLVFASSSTNLDRADTSPGMDVYVRTLQRKFKHFGRGRAAQTIMRGTRLVSATASGTAGNGASSHPTVSDDGRYVAYDTLASDLVAGDSNGVSDIVRADLDSWPPAQLAVSTTGTSLGNGASTQPSMSSAGHFIAFQSDSSNLKMRPDLLDDRNGVCDVMVGVVGLGAASVESLNNLNQFVTTPSDNPSISAHGNYVAFESADRLMDTSEPNPGVRAIYLRYLGPAGS
jgi:Tol biopolymer transport system component